ncbi:hypothetical protein [Rhizobium sp. BK068]|uniref:hypothetical protein n=1 Tax=Rhizobium sp. BK068 TaxID=2512130 RepID=UPI001050DB98|nr:hypothetical protein [Rhizobium sp. BK068]TCM65759.1 hypothetical protein EV291_14237 [Rhizobium sp. BK068]
MEEHKYLPDLVDDILNHLAGTDPEYRAAVADAIYVHYRGDNDVLDGIKEVLLDPDTKGQVATTLASRLLNRNFVYQGDSIVSVSDFGTSAS